MGRRKGVTNSKPVSGSRAEKIVELYDEKSVSRWQELAEAVGCSESNVLEVLNRWRPEWRNVL